MTKVRFSNSGILLLQKETGLEDEEGQGAAMLSFRSQMNPTPEVVSHVTSEGKLGRRQPDSDWKYGRNQSI